MPRLLRHSGRALYRQVGDDLAGRVASGELAAGARLPSEAQLAQDYGVNRLTVRRALEEAVRSGLLRTEHGVGSFVASRPTRHRIDDGEASLSESMARRGLAVRHQILDITEVDLRAENAFPDFPGDGVRFRFVRALEGEPWSLSEIVLPASLAPRNWEGEASVFAAFGDEHGLTVRRAERAFSAAPAEPEAARWLGVPVGAALLVLSGFNSDQHGRTVATVAHQIRGDRGEYVVRLPE